MNKSKAFLTLLSSFTLDLSNAAAQQTYTYTTIAYPGSSSTYVAGVNDGGVVIGMYCNSRDICTGFSYQNGSYQTISGPKGQITRVTAINNQGVMTGFYFGAVGRSVGFVVQGGTFFPFSQPGYDVYMTGVSSVGEAVGTEREEGGYATNAVTFKNGVFSIAPLPDGTWLAGTNSSGSIVGTLCYSSVCPAQAFTRDSVGTHVVPNMKYPYSYGVGINDAGMTLTSVTTQNNLRACAIIASGHVTPCTHPGALASNPTAINQLGDVVGGVHLKTGTTAAFVRDRNGIFSTVAPPDAVPNAAVYALAISDTGLIAGDFYPVFGGQFAYLATPVTDAPGSVYPNGPTQKTGHHN